MTGRHRRHRRFQGVVGGFSAVMVVLALGLGGWVAYRHLNLQSCSGQRQALTIAAAPEIVPAVSATASKWQADRGPCVSVAVTGVEPADLAATLAARHNATLTGLGQPASTAQVPTVWIPDSSVWLERVKQVGADLVPEVASSVAQSPVVLAMPQPVASQLGWPQATLTWPQLLARLSGPTALHAGIVDPLRDASGLSGLLALSAAAQGTGAAAQQNTVAALRALAVAKSAARTDLLDKFPATPDPQALANGLAAAPLTEQAVIAYNGGKPAVPLAELYVNPAPLAMDYPYAVLPGASAGLVALAGDLRSALTGQQFRDELAKQGLRAPDGTYGAGFPTGQGAPKGPLAPGEPVQSNVVEQVLSSWDSVTRPGRALSVIDVSGSMLTPVPTAGGLTREQVTVRAAQQGLQLFGDDWVVGLWVFATQLDGNKPYREVSPLRPLGDSRDQMNRALGGVQPIANGNTGLYDTVLAAYKTVQNGYDPTRVNSVIVMTDGQNDNPGGLTLAQLRSQLQQIVDPKRPVEVVLLGIGPEVNKPELDQIVQAAGGGGAFVAKDPSQVGSIFLQAIALRPRTGA
ncbi:MAG: VWA domain-containing protein [Micromonosporaceae bacterium]|nr:VWA domain-containing protein [Micromonosporaceae bacterium]